MCFLKQRLQPVPTPDPRRLTGLFAELDDERFQVRQRATRELEKLAETAGTSANSASEETLSSRRPLPGGRRPSGDRAFAPCPRDPSCLARLLAAWPGCSLTSG